MKEFVVYTLLRLLLFAATLGVVMGVWGLVAGSPDLLVSLVVAFLVSGVASLLLLNRQRESFAERVDARARRATERYEAMRAKEDVD